MVPDADEEAMEDMILDDERQRHWSIVFEYNDVGVDDKKVIVNAKRWDVYMNENRS